MPPVALVVGATVAAVAVTYTAMKAQLKTPTASDVDRGLDLTRKLDPDYPREVAVGLVASAGSGLYDTVSGPENKYGWRVTGLSDYEITGFQGLLIAGEQATLSGDPLQGWVNVTSHFLKKDGSPSVRLRVLPGTMTQTLDPELAAAAGPGSHGGELTAADTFAGIAHAILRFEFSQDDELTREPANVVYVYEGAPVHDPRDPASDVNDAATWSRTSSARFNSALVTAQAIRGWHRNGQMIVGAEGVTGADIPDAKLITEADICDEAMEIPGGTEPRYRCGGFVRMSQREGIRPSLAKLLATMDGDLVENGGEFIPLAGVERVPSAHYDVQALEGRVITFDEHGSATDRINGTVVTFVDPSAGWQSQPLEAYQPQEYLDEDDGRSHWQSIGLQNVFSRHQAERIKLARAVKARPRGSITVELPLIAQQTEPGDWITLTDSVTGLVASVWDVETVSRVNDPKKGPRIIIAASGIDVTPWQWSQAAADGVRVPDANSYPDDRVPTAAAPVLSLEAIDVAGGGASEPAIKASYVIGESPLSSHVEFQWWQSSKSGEVFSASCEKQAGALVLREGISPDTEYKVRARLTGGPTRNGAWSDPGTISASSTFSVPAVGGLTADQISAASQAAADAAAAAQATADGAEASAEAALGEWDDLATGLGVPAGQAPEGILAELGDLEATDDETLVRINRLEPPSENLIQDAWFKVGGGEFWLIGGRTPADLVPAADAMRVGAEVEAAAAGPGVTLSYSVRKPVKADEVFEISAGVFTSGVAAAPKVQLVIYDVEFGGTVQETLSEVVTANTRDGSVAIAPTVDGWAQFEVTVDASSAGTLTLDIEAPVWRVADDGQAAISAEPSRDDPSLVLLEEIQRINHRLAASESVWHAESERGFADLSEETQARIDEDGVLAAQATALEAQITGVSDDLSTNYLSIASADLLYLTAAEVDSAISLFDLSLNASHQSVVTDLATLDDEVDAIALDLASNYYTSAEADLTFTTLAEVNAAISTYAVTIGATTQTLEAWVEDHDAELDPAVPGSTANVAVNALAQADFGSEFDTRWNTAISTYAVTVNSASRTLVAHLDHVEDGVDGVTADLAANYYTQAEANAQFMTGTEVDSAIGAYQVTVNASTRTILGHLDHIEDLADTTAADLAANYLTEAEAHAQFMTATEVDSAIGLYSVTVNASTRTIAGHLDHIEDGVDAVTSDLAANYLTTAQAQAEFMTASEVDSAIGLYSITVNASTRTISGHLDHIEDGVDGVTTDLATNYYTQAEANSQFMTASEVDSAIGAWTVSVNASTRTLGDHLNHIEDTADATALDLASNYYTEAEADLAFMTAAEVDSAIATYGITIGATTQAIEAWVSEHAGAITTMQGGGATYALELGVGDRVLGVRGLNDGLLRSFAFELDTFIINDGTSDVQPFFYDAVAGLLTLQNIAVDGADIKDASIDQLRLKSGSVGQWVSATMSSHDLCPGSPGDPKFEGDFAGVSLVTPELMVRDNDLLVASYDYEVDAEYDCLQWFYWRTRMTVYYKTITGTWLIGKSWPWKVFHIGRSSASHSSDAGYFTPSDSFARSGEVVVPPPNPGGNWVHTTLEETEVYLEFELEPYGPGSGTQCRFGGPRPTRIAPTLQLSDLSLRLMKLSSGGFTTS